MIVSKVSKNKSTEKVARNVGKEEVPKMYDNDDDQIKKMASTIVDYLVEGGLGEEVGKQHSDAPDILITNTVVWMAHCINLPFLPQDKNVKINMELRAMLNDFRKAVKAGDQNATNEVYNIFQDKVKEKFGLAHNIPMDVFKFCSLSKDLLDMYKMVIEDKRDEDVLSGKGSIRRILKYSIELGSPAKTLNALVNYFVNNSWFDNMKEQVEWHKLALECMMVTGNGEMGNKILGLLQDEGRIGDDEKEELLDHAREYRSQLDISWM